MGIELSKLTQNGITQLCVNYDATLNSPTCDYSIDVSSSSIIHRPIGNTTNESTVGLLPDLNQARLEECRAHLKSDPNLRAIPRDDRIGIAHCLKAIGQRSKEYRVGGMHHLVIRKNGRDVLRIDQMHPVRPTQSRNVMILTC